MMGALKTCLKYWLLHENGHAWNRPANINLTPIFSLSMAIPNMSRSKNVVHVNRNPQTHQIYIGPTEVYVR